MINSKALENFITPMVIITLGNLKMALNMVKELNIIKMGKKYTKVILQIIKKKEKEKDITLMGIII